MIDGVIRCCITETVELKKVAVQQGVGDPCIKEIAKSTNGVG
jgi:hypothetical protein